ncbi:MAG: hypothetical protein BZ136_04590 [Methanosphaera sp. rholeuAM74]|nr:MAG: hypothetical protein BZ136_04590 [Methanosphaera sp. rholeuAM74]
MPENNSLGRGLDALIKTPKDKKEEVTEAEPAQTIEEVEQIEEEKTTQEVKNTQITPSDEIVDQIKEEVKKSARISVWSPQSAATLKYLKNTIPNFSMSKDAARLLDEVVSTEYPEIWKLFEK